MPDAATKRLDYIDWLRGFACLGMFEVHCYDAWLSDTARSGSFYGWSRFSGTVPAPLFVFLSGVACALVTDKMRRKGCDPHAPSTRIIRRGLGILGLALLFRLQQFIFAWPWAPGSDLMRVDVLNMFGVSIILMGIALRVATSRTSSALLAAAVSLGIALASPPLWTTWRPHWLPWYIESYINGVHIYNVPQAWLFPIFPWTAFAFAGLAVGFMLMSEWATRNPTQTIGILSAAGVGMFFLSRWLDHGPIQIYAVYDYWHTSPNFFLARLGMVLVLVGAGYVWCNWGLGRIGFSPFMQLGQTSLLVYWVHTELVYGRFSILQKGAQSIPMATFGLLMIFVMMVLLSMARTRLKGKGVEILSSLRRMPRTATGD